jgi:hypothetical protein
VQPERETRRLMAADQSATLTHLKAHRVDAIDPAIAR